MLENLDPNSIQDIEGARPMCHVAGVILIVIGLFVVQGTLGWVLAIVGLVPLLAGVFDFCVFAPLFGLPFVGERLRQALVQGE